MTGRLGALGVVLCALTVKAADKPLSVVITGDNGGEVAPCGCQMNPTGGLAKRKTVLQSWVGQPLLVVDAGNALFRSAGGADAKAQARAQFIAQTMAKLGTVAMAVGHRDLSAGAAFLKASAEKAKLKLLSANLRDGEQKPFAGSMVWQGAGVKVGLIGLSPSGPVLGSPTLNGGAVVEAAKAQLQVLKGKVDVVVLLAAVPYAEALALAQALHGQADFIVQSSDSRGQVAQEVAGAYLIGAGDRGRAIARLDLNLGNGKGAWVDLAAQARDAQSVALLEQQLITLKERLKMTSDPQAKRSLQETLTQMQKRHSEQIRKAQGAVAAGARTLTLQWKALDSAVGDDESLKKEVLVHEPTYAGH
ncbi:MAG: 5'-nucleotidase [Myxococcaceae bacterium]|nr:5'-nucleotidase [Myxococcaceae bacterium]